MKDRLITVMAFVTLLVVIFLVGCAPGSGSITPPKSVPGVVIEPIVTQYVGASMYRLTDSTRRVTCYYGSDSRGGLSCVPFQP